MEPGAKRRAEPCTATSLPAASRPVRLPLCGAAVRTTTGAALPAELIADRTLVALPVRTFLSVLGAFGGPIRATEIAFAGTILAAAAAASSSS